MTIIEAFLDLIFPPKCAVCGALGKDILCKKCLEEIKYLDRQLKDLPSKLSFDIAFAATSYEGPVKEAIRKFKFRDKRAFSEPLTNILIKFAENNLSAFKNVELIIPVPLFESRQKGRGFNQSGIFAEAAARHLDRPISETALFRTRNTKPQFDLMRADRFANVAGAFKVSDPDEVKGKTILLIDDILTTGATASECARVLKDAGAVKVIILTLSRAIED